MDLAADSISLLNPGVHPRAGNPEVTGIPQVDSSTSQRQLTSTHAEVTYLIKLPIRYALMPESMLHVTLI